MFGTDGKKSYLIVFRKCQENLQDKASVTGRLRRKDSAAEGGEEAGGSERNTDHAQQKGYTFYRDCCFSFNVTFQF